jgi:hypothetical protein
MTTRTFVGNRSEQTSDIRLEVMQKNELLRAVEVEQRLQNLNERLTGMNAAPYLVRLRSGVHHFDRVLDLRVKAEAVRWMLRIAKHLNAPARETVFLTVMHSLEQLEKAVETGVALHETGVRGAAPIEPEAHRRSA